MTRSQIFELARKMATQLRDGLKRAAHYLRSLGVSVEEAISALFARTA